MPSSSCLEYDAETHDALVKFENILTREAWIAYDPVPFIGPIGMEVSPDIAMLAPRFDWTAWHQWTEPHPDGSCLRFPRTLVKRSNGMFTISELADIKARPGGIMIFWKVAPGMEKLLPHDIEFVRMPQAVLDHAVSMERKRKRED